MASAAAEALKSALRAFRDQMTAAGASGPVSVADLRASEATMADTTAAPIGVADTAGIVGGVPGRWITPAGASPVGTVLYLHGGGYVIGSSATHAKMVGHLVNASGCQAFVADYRLAPEHPHPAALADAVSAYRGLLDQGIEPGHLVVAGDSAGGGLAVALAVALRDSGVALPVALLGLSPWVDLAITGATTTTRAEVDLLVTPALIAMMADLYLGQTDRRTPTASPLYADLAGLMPMYLQVGDEEVLLDDARRLAERAAASGVEVTLEVFPEMQHVFQLGAGNVPEATEAIAKLGAYARARVS
jgi:acetyl esterase/lipase